MLGTQVLSPFNKDIQLPLTLCLLDKTGERFFHIAGWWWSVILGFVISLCTMSVPARYISMFLMSFGYVGGYFSYRDERNFL
jgi:hypothetical protein